MRQPQEKISLLGLLLIDRIAYEAAIRDGAVFPRPAADACTDRMVGYWLGDCEDMLRMLDAGGQLRTIH